MALLAGPGVWAMKGTATEDAQAVQFAATNSGIQAALDYCAPVVLGNPGGKVYIGPGLISGLTGLKMYPNTTLEGSGMNETILRFTGSGTAALRERSAAEGNTHGAEGIWVKNIRLDGSGFTGDGINLGNQVNGQQLNFNAGLENVHVRSFTGTGMDLYCNAICNKYIWSNANTTGFIFRGGSSTHLGVWAEGNSLLDINVLSGNDNFHGIHCEGSAGGPSDPYLQISGYNNNFYGINVSMPQNRTNIVVVKTGFNRACFYGVEVSPNGFTYSNLIYNETWATGTGSSLFFIPAYIDNNTQSSFIYDSNVNELTTITGARINAKALTSALLSCSSDFPISSGNLKLDNTQGIQVKDTGGTYRTMLNAAGGSDNTRIHALSAAGQVQFNNFADTFNNLVITDAGAVTVRAGMTAATVTASSLTSGKYTKAGASGLLTDGPTPLAGTKIYWVSDTSGGAVNRKLTFVDGILTAET